MRRSGCQKMSIPTELLAQLLTGYLDDALSQDERIRVESLLQSDPLVAAKLAELRDLQESLRAIAEIDSHIRLDSGFADRVLGAVIDRATTEGLSEDHPVVRLANQSNSLPTAPVHFVPFRYAVVLVGLAASIAIAVVMLRPEANDNRSALALAGIGQPQNHAFESRTDVPMGDDLRGDLELPANNDSLVQRDSIADHDGDPNSLERATNNESEKPSLQKISAAEIPSVDARSVDSAGVDAISINNPSKQIAQRPAPKQRPTIQLGAILVLEVRLTDSGQMSDAIATCMNAAGLQSADEKQLPNELVDQLVPADEAIVSDQAIKVMYLQAPAKRLDLFYLNLMKDQVGVESIGMSLATNLPILQIVQSVAPDPTTIRHTSTAYELTAQQSAVGDFAGELSRLNFAPLNREVTAAMSQNDPDEPAQILLLVR